MAVSNKSIFLHVIVPHLHEVFLSSIDVREIVDHLARLDPQPLWVRVILIVLAVEDGVRGNWEASCAGSEGKVSTGW